MPNPPPPPPAGPLRARLQQALTDAMKARDQVAVSVLRSTLAAIANAEAVAPSVAPGRSSGVIAGAVTGLGAAEAARLDLTEDRIAEIVRAEADDRRAVAADYERAGRHDDATRLLAEVAVLDSHLGEPGST